MSMQFVKASASDALTLTEISKKAFDSDVQVGAPSAGGPPDYMSVPFHTKMARENHLYKLTDDGLIVGGAALFLDKDKLYVGRIFVSPEHHRKGYGSCIMREIEAAFSDVKEIALDTPIWNVRTNAFYLKLGYEEVKRDDEFIYYSKNMENQNRPVTTLFMLMSVDGKISTGATDELDVDKDFPKIDGLKEGVGQYYEIEQTTDLWSFNTGRVQEKMGANKNLAPQKTPVSFVLLDNSHLTEQGVKYFCAKSKEFVLITSNKNHPAFSVKEENLHILYQEQFSLKDALCHLKKDFGCERLTVQSGGTLNSIFLREKLFDFIDIVVAPALVGGKDTATLIDGKSLMSENELSGLGVLKLIECKVLKDSYIRLRYKVIG